MPASTPQEPVANAHFPDTFHGGLSGSECSFFNIPRSNERCLEVSEWQAAFPRDSHSGGSRLFFLQTLRGRCRTWVLFLRLAGCAPEAVIG